MELFPHDSNFNFMRLRWVSLGVAALLMFVALGAMAVNGFHYALDFTGGTVTELQFAKPVDVEQVRKRLVERGFDGAEVRTFGSASEVVVRLPLREEGTQSSGIDVQQGAQTADNPARLLRSVFVGPQLGKELALNGMYAAIFVVLGFFGYVMVRFEW